jgi:hypothetical protein
MLDDDMSDFRAEIMECLSPRFVAVVKQYGLSAETIIDWLEKELARRRAAKMELEMELGIAGQEEAADRFLKELVKPQPKPAQPNGPKFPRRA